MGEVLQQVFPDFWRNISEICCELVGFEERMMVSGLPFYIAMTLGEYNILIETEILWNKIQKLHTAAKWLLCNWNFIDKIEVKIWWCPPTHPNRNSVGDWYVALDVFLQDVKEQLCYFRSILPMTKNGCVMAGQKFPTIQSSSGLVYISKL